MSNFLNEIINTLPTEDQKEIRDAEAADRHEMDMKRAAALKQIDETLRKEMEEKTNKRIADAIKKAITTKVDQDVFVNYKVGDNKIQSIFKMDDIEGQIQDAMDRYNILIQHSTQTTKRGAAPTILVYGKDGDDSHLTFLADWAEEQGMSYRQAYYKVRTSGIKVLYTPPGSTYYNYTIYAVNP